MHLYIIRISEVIFIVVITCIRLALRLCREGFSVVISLLHLNITCVILEGLLLEGLVSGLVRLVCCN